MFDALINHTEPSRLSEKNDEFLRYDESSLSNEPKKRAGSQGKALHKTAATIHCQLGGIRKHLLAGGDSVRLLHRRRSTGRRQPHPPRLRTVTQSAVSFKANPQYCATALQMGIRTDGEMQRVILDPLLAGFEANEVDDVRTEAHLPAEALPMQGLVGISPKG